MRNVIQKITVERKIPMTKDIKKNQYPTLNENEVTAYT